MPGYRSSDDYLCLSTTLIGAILLCAYFPQPAVTQEKTGFPPSAVYFTEVNSQEEETPASNSIISIQSVPTGKESRVAANQYGLTRGDFKKISRTVAMFGNAIPIRYIESQVFFRDNKANCQIIGTDDSFAGTKTVRIEKGSFILPSDVRDSDNVCVINSSTAATLFGENNPIGESIRIQKNYFTVVGVAETLKPTKLENQQVVFIPLSTMQLRFGDRYVLRNKGSMELQVVQLHEIRISVNSMADERKLIDKLMVLLEDLHPRKDYILQLDESDSRD